MTNEAHLDPLERAQLSELEPIFAAVEASMGFVPNSMLTMARWPELLQAFAGLGGTILGAGQVSGELKQLIALVSSRAAGCQYCQAHTAHSAHRQGASEAKLAAAFEFRTSALFSDAERAALEVAAAAGVAPNAVSKVEMEALKNHFNEREVTEIIGVIALFGFLNRWNDSLATQLEKNPLRFANQQLKDQGWQAGKHA